MATSLLGAEVFRSQPSAPFRFADDEASCATWGAIANGERDPRSQRGRGTVAYIVIQIDEGAGYKISSKNGDLIVSSGQDSLFLEGVSERAFNERWVVEEPREIGRGDYFL